MYLCVPSNKLVPSFYTLCLLEKRATLVSLEEPKLLAMRSSLLRGKKNKSQRERKKEKRKKRERKEKCAMVVILFNDFRWSLR